MKPSTPDEHHERMVNDTAMATTTAILECFNLRPEEYQAAFDEVLPRVKGGLVYLITHHTRTMVRVGRLRPSKN